MIVPMKKVFIVTQGKDARQGVDALAELGVLHIEHERVPAGTEIAALEQELKMLDQTIEILNGTDPKDAAISETPNNWQQTAKEILGCGQQIAQLNEEILKRKALIKSWEKWGDFDPEDIRALESNGIYVQLYEGKDSDLKQLPVDCVVETLAKADKKILFVVISRRPVDLTLVKLALPPVSLDQMQALLNEDLQSLAAVEQKLKEDLRYLASFEAIRSEKAFELKFQQAVHGMGGADGIAYLKGFCPLDRIKVLEDKAAQEKWVVLVDDPSAEDQVPTLIRNPKWVEIVKPVFGVINVLPGYREIDISFVFLVFFSIFFGILIGDAGYGTVFLAATFFAQNKLKKKVADQSPFILMYVLSACALFWGGITGTIFGTLLFSHVIKPPVAWLTEVKNVQLICFFIGAVHLSIAHTWRLLMKAPAVFAMLAELGWIIILWGAFFMANSMVIGTSLFGIDLQKALIIFGAGGALVVADIISRPKDGIFIGLVLSFFSCISAFTDVVSYIRLFAVGLAGVAVADAFNQMALSVGFNNFAAGLITSVILVAGHIFNIVLCGFGILVHGLRLNVLEFSGHLGLEWSGFKYEPFKKLKQS